MHHSELIQQARKIAKATGVTLQQAIEVIKSRPAQPPSSFQGSRSAETTTSAPAVITKKTFRQTRFWSLIDQRMLQRSETYLQAYRQIRIDHPQEFERMLEETNAE